MNSTPQTQHLALHPLGLKPPKKDKRQLSRHQMYGTPFLPSDLPETFSIEDGAVQVPYQDQGDTDFCTNESTTESEAFIAGISFSPDYGFAKMKEISGDSPSVFGGDIRDAMKVGTTFGFLPVAQAPFSWQTKGRDFVADWHNWPLDLDKLAAPYKEGSYIEADGPFDHWNNVRVSMWHSFKTFQKRRAVILAAPWAWGYQYLGADGVAHVLSAADAAAKNWGWHAHEVLGWVNKTRSGVVLPSTMIETRIHTLEIGDNGYAYFDQPTFNQIWYLDDRSLAVMYDDAPAGVLTKMQAENQATTELLLILCRRALELIYEIIPMLNPNV